MANGDAGAANGSRKPLVLSGTGALVPIGVVIAVVLGALNFAGTVSNYRTEEAERETTQGAEILQLRKDLEEIKEDCKRHVAVDAKLMDARQREIEINLRANDLWKE